MTIARRAALAGLLAGGWLGAVRAADFPARPMNWIVPFPPGGSNDIFARPVAAFISQRLGEPVVVENRGGAGGTIGTEAVAKSAADGHTLVLATTSTHVVAPSVYSNIGYDPV